MATKRDPYDRRQAIGRIVAQLRLAIQREPLLRRLPSQRELADHFRASLRDVRSALDRMVAERWILATRGGYVVVRQPRRRRPPLQRVVLVHEAVFHSFLPFYQFIAKGADQRCRETGLAFDVRHVEPGQVDRQLAELAKRSPGEEVGWALAALAPGAELMAQWQAAARRVVLVDDQLPPRALPSIRLSHSEATQLAVEHLIGLGHRRFGTVTLAFGYPWAPIFVEEVRSALHDHGLDLMPNWDLRTAPFARPDNTEMVRAVKQLWAQRADRPTALVVRSMISAIRLLAACDTLGIDVPGRVSIVAVSGRYSWPGSDRQVTLASAGDAAELGGAAVDMLAKLADPLEAVAVKLPAKLMFSEATAAPPSPRR